MEGLVEQARERDRARWGEPDYVDEPPEYLRKEKKECEGRRVKTATEVEREREQQRQIYEVMTENRVLRERLGVLEAQGMEVDEGDAAREEPKAGETGAHGLDSVHGCCDCCRALVSLQENYRDRVRDYEALRKENDRLKQQRDTSNGAANSLGEGYSYKKKYEKELGNVKYLKERIIQLKKANWGGGQAEKGQTTEDQPIPERQPAEDQSHIGANHKSLLDRHNKLLVENEELKGDVENLRKDLQKAKRAAPPPSSDTLVNKVLRKELADAKKDAEEATSDSKAQSHTIRKLNLEIQLLKKQLSAQSQGQSHQPRPSSLAAAQKIIEELEKTIDEIHLDREHLLNARKAQLYEISDKEASIKDFSLKVSRLEDAIANLRKAGNRPGIPDWDIEREASNLHGRILQFVVKHCRNHGGSVGVHRRLATHEAKDAYVMALISEGLWKNVFAAEGMKFALGAPWDGNLEKLEGALRRGGTGKSFTFFIALLIRVTC